MCGFLSLGLVLMLFMMGGSRGAGGQVMAQTAPDSCEEPLEEAEDAYVNHQFERAIALTSRCVEQEQVAEEAAIDAYRLMSLSYFRQNALVDARSTINELLELDPSYEADPINDPPSYALFVSMVREGTTTENAEDSTWERRTRRVADVQPAEVSIRSPTLVIGSRPFGKNALNPEVASPESEERETVSVYGLRLTYRNQGIERVHGLNVTMWRPQTAPNFRGGVNGIALGIPIAGARHLNGIGVGIFGVEGSESLSGIGIGGVGLSAGRAHGLALGGLGVTVRERFFGLGLSGFVVGGSGSVQGVTVGGLGHAVGGSASGIQVGGIGIGAGENIQGGSVTGGGILSREGSVYGLQIGGLGVGAGTNIGGVTLGGLGVVSAEDLFGLSVAGGFLRAGDDLQGVHATSLVIMASQLQGISVASVIVGEGGTGLVAAPGYFHAGAEGRFTGLSVSAFNHIRGQQRGLAIGLFNYASSLRGVQLGLLNYAGNNPLLLRLLPGINLHF